MRKIVIADVTDFAGCVGSEHYYCKYQVMDNVEFISGHLYEFDTLGVYSHDDLWYKPSREYAEKMVLKDNDGIMSEDQVEDLVERGTTRFEYLHDIKRELENQFPDCEIIIAKDRSVSDFWNSYLHEEYRMAFNELSDNTKKEIFDTIMEDPTFYDRYTDSAKYDKMFVDCFRKGRYSKLAQLIKEYNKKN